MSKNFVIPPYPRNVKYRPCQDHVTEELRKRIGPFAAFIGAPAGFDHAAAIDERVSGKWNM
jgi:hypothetical protein